MGGSYNLRSKAAAPQRAEAPAAKRPVGKPSANRGRAASRLKSKARHCRKGGGPGKSQRQKTEDKPERKAPAAAVAAAVAVAAAPPSFVVATAGDVAAAPAAVSAPEVRHWSDGLNATAARVVAIAGAAPYPQQPQATRALPVPLALRRERRRAVAAHLAEGLRRLRRLVHGGPAPSAVGGTDGGVSGRGATLPPLPSAAHVSTFRRLRTSILAAGHHGHRTSHALWGVSGAGKRRILGHLARSLRACGGVLVIELDGVDVEGDEDGALRRAVDQVIRFLSRSGSAAIREQHPQFRRPHALFHMAAPAPGARGDPAAAAAAGSMVGMLAHLQNALVALNKAGVSIVFLIADLALFALWCDRLTYLFSGLMHECDPPGGAVSLVVTSTTPDVPLEKRLSSRLSCELIHVPCVRLSLAAAVAFALSPDGNRHASTPGVVPLDVHLSIVGPVSDLDALGDLPPRAVVRLANTYLLNQASNGVALAIPSAGALLQLLALHDECPLAALGGDTVSPAFAAARDAFHASGGGAAEYTDAPDAGDAFSGRKRQRDASGPHELLSNCPREAFVLLAQLYTNEEEGRQRTLEETFANILTWSTHERRDAPGDLVAFQRALQYLQRLGLVAVSRRAMLSIIGDRVRVHAFLAGTLRSDERSVACGIDTGERNVLSGLVR